MKNNKILDILIAAAVAIGLWTYVVSVDNPPMSEVLKNIPVQLLNADTLQASGLTIAGDGKYTVDVVIRGQRTDVMGVKSADITATADLMGMSAGQGYIDVSVKAPSTVTVEEIRTSKIQVYIDALVNEAKPVHFVATGLEDGHEIAQVKLDIDSIEVSGAKRLVDMVKYVAITADASSVETDGVIKQQLQAVPVDAEGNQVGGVSLNRQYVNAEAKIFSIKTVKLNVPFAGSPGYGAEITKINVPETIAIKGTLLALSQIDTVNAEQINVEGLIGDSVVPIVPILPAGVEVASQSANISAEIGLSADGLVSYEYALSEIQLQLMSDNIRVLNVYNSDAEKLIVNVTGAVEALSNVTKENFVPVAIVSETETGEYETAVVVNYSGSDEFKFETTPGSVIIAIEAIITD